LPFCGGSGEVLEEKVSSLYEPMFRILNHSSVSGIVLLLLVLSPNMSSGQSIAIHLDGSNRALIKAESPTNLAYRIQASTSFENWVDISDQASGPFSFLVAATNDQKQVFRLRTWPVEEISITLVMVGDSTLADFAANSEKFYGWGPGINGCLKPNVQVINFGMPLQSTRTFLISIQRDNLTIIRPDFVLVQLGLMDTSEMEFVYTSLADYERNLRNIIEIIRGFAGTPILVTPAAARRFDITGRIAPGFLEDRCAVIRKLSAELNVYLIDLKRLSEDLYNQLGPTQSAYITASEADRLHFTEAGTRVIGELVANAFPTILQSHVLPKDQSHAR
jgi:lysophospholipase L1-like esterase